MRAKISKGAKNSWERLFLTKNTAPMIRKLVKFVIFDKMINLEMIYEQCKKKWDGRSRFKLY